VHHTGQRAHLVGLEPSDEVPAWRRFDVDQRCGLGDELLRVALAEVDTARRQRRSGDLDGMGLGHGDDPDLAVGHLGDPRPERIQTGCHQLDHRQVRRRQPARSLRAHTASIQVSAA